MKYPPKEPFYFWSWLQENHPVAHEMVWWTVDLMCLISIIISIVTIAAKVK